MNSRKKLKWTVHDKNAEDPYNGNVVMSTNPAYGTANNVNMNTNPAYSTIT